MPKIITFLIIESDDLLSLTGTAIEDAMRENKVRVTSVKVNCDSVDIGGLDTSDDLEKRKWQTFVKAVELGLRDFFHRVG